MNAPFDVMRTRLNLGISSVVYEKKLFQLTKLIWKKEGIRGFYVGFTGNLVGIPLFTTLNMSSYYYLKNYLYKNYSNGKSISNLLRPWRLEHKFGLDTLSSIITGCLTQLVTNPIWVCKTRLQSQKLHKIDDYRNIFDAMNKITRREGVYGLFKGLVPSMFGVTHFIIYIPLYDFLNRFHDSYFEKNSGNWNTSLLTL